MKSPFTIRKQTRRAAPRRPHLAGLQAVILALSFQGAMAAESPIAAVQESLKRQQFYVGAPTGVVDDATRDALRRFQIHHNLPASGEIDAGTIEKLQGSPAAARPTVAAQSPAAAAGPQPSPAVVEKDRQFLQKIETGTEPSAPTAQVAPPPPAPAPAAAARLETQKPAVASSQPLEKPREIASRKIERPRMAPSGSAPEAREMKPAPLASTPPRRAGVGASAPPSPIVVEHNLPEARPSRGTTVTRTTTTGTGPDGRTYIHEKTTTTITGKPAPEIEIRRAEPVQPRRKAPTFFDKLFNEDID